MKELLQSLVRLQSLEFDKVKDGNPKKSIADLRAKIPAPILEHYDRLAVRGKKGITAVQNQVCTGCHMRVPMGVIMTLMHEQDIQICDSCGRYLYLAETTAKVESPVPVSEVKPVKKAPRRKANPNLV
jgi:predicted  nucleic acid-binding Zn-ribbon protein